MWIVKLLLGTGAPIFVIAAYFAGANIGNEYEKKIQKSNAMDVVWYKVKWSIDCVLAYRRTSPPTAKITY